MTEKRPATDPKKIRVYLWDQMVLVGFGLAVFYYVFDTTLFLFMNYDVNFFKRLLGPDIGEIWSRLALLCLFVIFGAHAQFTINQRQAAQAAVRESEEKYRNIVETSEDGYYEVDTAGRLTFFNGALCRILGYSREEMGQVSLRIPLDAKNTRTVVRAFYRVFKTGEPARAVSWTVRRRDGAARIVESSISLIRDHMSRPAGFSGFLRDVTERTEAEALQQAKRAAEAANRAKSEFIAKVSHEIRTPLNAIIGMSELLRGTDLSTRQREDLDVVLSSGYALLSIINNILDFSKIEAGRLDLEETEFNPATVVHEALRIMAMRCHEKDLELICRVDPSVPDTVYGDPGRFRQVLTNLVHNAYKYTDAGEIFVQMSREDTQEAGPFLHVWVSDTGIGIPIEYQDRIFSAFSQVEPAGFRRQGGIGLGLAVSAQLVKLLGGRMWLESRPGRGCTFHFTACFDGLLTPRPAAAPAAPQFYDKHVLVVDDSATTCRVLVEMLSNWQLKPTAALGVEEARQVLRSSLPPAPPVELVLLDDTLDDAQALADWIRGREEFDPVIVALQTFQSRHFDLDLEEYGIAAGILKPVRAQELLTTITTALCLDGDRAEIEAGAQENRLARFPRPLKILVAEDTPLNQKYILRLLERWDHAAELAENGRQAFKKASAESYDLILMDVQMPEMDGYAATRAIRKAERGSGRHVPIVAMTAHAVKGDRERCLQAGMDAYLAKPISSGKLLEVLEKIAAPAPEEAEEPLSLAPKEIDAQMLQETFDQDWDFFREVLDMFISDYPQMLADLHETHQNGDAAYFSRKAHALKGMVSLFKAPEATAIVQTLETLGRQGKLEEAKEELERLTAALERLKIRLLEFSEARGVDSSSGQTD